MTLSHARPTEEGNRSRIARWLVLLLALGIMVLGSIQYYKSYYEPRFLNGRELPGMAVNELQSSYNIIRHATYSERRDAAPTAWRDPLNAFFMVPIILATGFDEDTTLEDLTDQDRLFAFRMAHFVVVVVTSFVSAISSYTIFRSLPISIIIYFLVLGNISFRFPVEIIRGDVLEALFMTSFFLSMLHFRTSNLAVLVGAMSYGLLCMVSAAFIYILPFFVAAWVAYVYFGKNAPLEVEQRTVTVGKNAWAALKKPVVFLLVAAIFPGGWMVRNTISLDMPTFGGRGGVVLAYRAEKNEFSPTTALAYALYEIPYVRQRNADVPFISTVLAWENIEPFVRINPETRERNEASVHHRVGAIQRREVLSLYQDDYPSHITLLKADRHLRSEALGRILESPVKHTLMSIPIFIRGMWFDRDTILDRWTNYRLGGDVRAWLTYVFVLGSWAGLIWMFFWAARRGNSPVVLGLFPTILFAGFLAFLTHYRTRYNVPIVPILCLGFGFVLYQFGGMLKGIATTTFRLRAGRPS